MVESPDSTPMQTSPTANSVATAHQVTIDAGSVLAGNQRSVLDAADAAALEIEHRHAHQLGKE